MKGISSPIRKLGAWVSRSENTTYNEGVDGTVHAKSSAGGEVDALACTDGDNPPTTSRTACWSVSAYSGVRCGLTMKVRKGDYWRIVNMGAVALEVFWIPG